MPLEVTACSPHPIKSQTFEEEATLALLKAWP
jgi:hypothetical protein